MSKEDLIKSLKDLVNSNVEMSHIEADDLLIEYIDDKDIKEAYEALDKWYA